MDCYNKKIYFSAGFTKIGFYLARAWLEKQRPKENFSDLLFTQEVQELEPPDWRIYDPSEEKSIDSYLEEGLYDPLDNLTGPWKFHGQNGVNRSNTPDDERTCNALDDEKISALEGID